MKGNDFFAGDRMIAVVPNNSVDNVCMQFARWLVGYQFTQGESTFDQATGKSWRALRANIGVAPVEGLDWTEIPNVTTLPSIIYCDGVAGTVTFIPYGDSNQLSQVANIAAGGLLLGGRVRVNRVLAAGTTATLLKAVAE